MRRTYISQSDWVDAIMGLVENLDEEGKQDLYDRIESEQYYNLPTREELEERIEQLEDERDELQGERDELKEELKNVERG